MSTSATGRIAGASSAFTEIVAPTPRPSHTARRTVTSSRHQSASATVSVANARAAPSAAIGPVIHRLVPVMLTSPAAMTAPSRSVMARPAA